MCQIAPSYRLDFLYDENDELFGFIKDGSSKYSYVRDFLQNITGIIDSSGKFVVKYNCSAYGNVSVLQDTNGLASINPFLYKGYYFDKESGMFYCHTRYYVPEWCRWLNADSIEFYNPSSLFEQNFYCYCNNNPVCYIDPSSYIAVFLIGLIVGAIIGAGIGFGVTAYRDYKDDGEVFNGSIPWYEYVASTVAGGVIGGGIGAGIGYLLPTGASVALGGGLSITAGGAATVSGIGAGIIETMGILGALGGIYLFAKGSGPRMGHNQHENQMFKEAMRQLNIKSKSDPRWDMLRRAVEREKKKTGRYLNTLKELLEFLRSKL